MTRITNPGRKRTYVEATFNYNVTRMTLMRRSLIPQILFRLPPASSIIATVTSHRNARRTRRRESTQMARAASCAEKRPDFRFRPLKGTHQRVYPLPTRRRGSWCTAYFWMYPEDSAQCRCRHVASKHTTSGDGCGVGDQCFSLRNGRAPCPGIS